MAGRIGWASAALTAGMLAGLFAGGAASAQAPGQLYLKGFGGATFPQSDDFTLHSELPGASAQSGLDFDTGYVAGFAGGYKITPNVAVELEYAYRSADVSVNNVSEGASPRPRRSWSTASTSSTRWARRGRSGPMPGSGSAPPSSRSPTWATR